MHLTYRLTSNVVLSACVSSLFSQACFVLIVSLLSPYFQMHLVRNDHVDNNRLPKKIKPLPLHSRVVYLEKISHFTQVLSDSLVGCPASGVN